MARYFRRGTTKVYFVTTIANVNAPSASIVAAGTDITCDIAEISGFAFQNNPISVPDMCSPFVKKIAGEDTADDSTMTFYDTNPAGTLWTTKFVKGAAGYIVFLPYGGSGALGVPAAADDAEVWPVSVAKATREWSAGNDAAKFMVTFTITDVPGLHPVMGT